jgi:hypothetical protein
MPLRALQSTASGLPCARLWPLLLGPLLVGCVSATPSADAPSARAEAASCSLQGPRVNNLEQLDPLSTFSPAGGLLAHPEAETYRGFYALEQPPPPPRETPAGPAEFRLNAKAVVAPGEPLDLKLHVINRSRGNLSIARPTLNDDRRSTFAYYDLYLRPEGEHRSYSFRVANVITCDAAVLSDKFERLDVERGRAKSFDEPEGERRALDRVRLLSPGRYVLWAVYRNCAAEPNTTGVERPEPLMGEYASNSVTIEVR